MNAEPDELELDELDPETRRKVLELLAETKESTSLKTEQEETEERIVNAAVNATRPKYSIWHANKWHWQIENIGLKGPAKLAIYVMHIVFLDRFHLPRGYERNVFDCSDSSAMLQWALTISGFKASIVTGPCPWDKNSGIHAWAIVHCNDCTAAVEATALTKRGFLEELFRWSTPGLIYSNNPSAANYYRGYTTEYPDIYAAARAYGSVKEWEWWAGAWGFK